MRPPEFIILTGFLGSGKTTLLLDFLGLPEAADSAILVNDVGAIDVDGIIVTGAETGMPVNVLANGCVCCSIGNRLVDTIDGLMRDRAASGKPPFSRLILECSGLSRPGPIMRSLADLGAHRFGVRIIATFDPGQGAAHARNFAEAAAQLAAAQTIVVTKLDGTTDDARASTAGRAAHAFNQDAALVVRKDRAARAREAFLGAAGPLKPASGARHDHGTLDHPRIGRFSIDVPAETSWELLSFWIEDLSARCGDGLLRTKGVVAVADEARPILIQGVGTVFSPPVRVNVAAGTPAGRIVVITCDTPKSAIEETAAAYGFTLATA